jgi:hypothetical protein
MLGFRGVLHCTLAPKYPSTGSTVGLVGCLVRILLCWAVSLCRWRVHLRVENKTRARARFCSGQVQVRPRCKFAPALVGSKTYGSPKTQTRISLELSCRPDLCVDWGSVGAGAPVILHSCVLCNSVMFSWLLGTDACYVFRQCLDACLPNLLRGAVMAAWQSTIRTAS